MRYLMFFLFIVTAASCVKDDFCIEPKAVAMTMNFKTYDSTDKKIDTFLVNASVYNTDTSYFFAQDKEALKTVNVALSRNVRQQTYIIKQTTERDTIRVSYTSEDVFISNGCGYQTYFDLQKITHTRHDIDSVNIIESKVDNTPQNPHLEVIYK